MKTTFLFLFVMVTSTSMAQRSTDFFDVTNDFLSRHCSDGKVNYRAVQRDTTLTHLINRLGKDPIPTGKEKAYLINAYNLFVISKITEAYPVGSPMDDSGFFTDKTFLLNGSKTSLDHLENQVLRKDYTDPRLHFVLVCGAISCPQIEDFAYRPETLDAQMDAQAQKALNNSDFVYQKTNDKSIYLSEIFSWYQEDFGKNPKEVVTYINGYRKEPFNTDFKVKYYPYNWTLNDQATGSRDNSAEEPLPTGTSLQLFTAGSLLKKGQMDFTLFNTLYTQDHGNWLGSTFRGNRETFVTHLFQYTLGVSKNKRFNVGVDLNFRYSGRSSDTTLSGISQAFAFQNNDSSRVGLTSVGLRVKVQPFKQVADFSIQSTFLTPTVEAPEGRSATDSTTGLFWADWNRYTWWNQFFYSKTWGDFQLFTELDLWFRFKRNETQIGLLDIPVSAFISYFPTNKITIYGMTQHVHRFTNNIDPNNPIINDGVAVPMNYTASGLGFKYQFMPNLNVELLYTNFWRGRNSGLGNTFNIGIKFLTK